MGLLGVYRFGDFEFDPQRLELRNVGSQVRISTQPARLLKILLESAPETVSRARLQEKIWAHGTTVEFEQGLNVCVNQLRTALGESASAPRYVETLPKRGYRFKGDVDVVGHRRVGSISRYFVPFVTIATVVLIVYFSYPNRAPEPATRGLFVAPVQIEGAGNHEANNLTQYALRLGVVDLLHGSKIEGFHVLGGSTLWANQSESALSNQADFVLHMILSLDTERDAINALLVDSNATRIVHQQIFLLEDTTSDQLALASTEIAGWVSRVLGVPITVDPRVIETHPRAYHQFMFEGRRNIQLGSVESLNASIEAFDAALAISPLSMEAMGGKSLALAVLAGTPGYPSNETYERALMLADEIRAIGGPTKYSALARGYIYLYRDWNLARAADAFDLAAEIAPGSAIVHSWRAALLAARNKPLASAESAELAVKIDPLSMAVLSDRCTYLNLADLFTEAVEACKWALEIDPQNYWARVGLATALEQRGRPDDAKNILTPMAASLQAHEQAPEVGIHQLNISSLRDAQCAIADQLGSPRYRGQAPGTELAAFLAQCGRYDSAFQELRKSLESGESGMLFFAIDARFDDFRERFPDAQKVLAIQSRPS